MRKQTAKDIMMHGEHVSKAGARAMQKYWGDLAEARRMADKCNAELGVDWRNYPLTGGPGRPVRTK